MSINYKDENGEIISVDKIEEIQMERKASLDFGATGRVICMHYKDENNDPVVDRFIRVTEGLK